MKEAHIECLIRSYRLPNMGLPNDTLFKGQTAIVSESMARASDEATHGVKVRAISIRYVERTAQKTSKPAPPPAQIKPPVPVAPPVQKMAVFTPQTRHLEAMLALKAKAKTEAAKAQTEEPAKAPEPEAPKPQDPPKTVGSQGFKRRPREDSDG
jgi:hypothetical protein